MGQRLRDHFRTRNARCRSPARGRGHGSSQRSHPDAYFWGEVQNTEYGNTEGAETRNTEIRRRTTQFCARATLGAAETAFPLRTAIEKHSFGLLSSSSIHWCNEVGRVETRNTAVQGAKHGMREYGGGRNTEYGRRVGGRQRRGRGAVRAARLHARELQASAAAPARAGRRAGRRAKAARSWRSCRRCRAAKDAPPPRTA
eukprot:5501030-Prymnesium_polylepis.2